jgi:uncharacterized membrane protein HdeD (DUF308 family)
MTESNTHDNLRDEDIAAAAIARVRDAELPIRWGWLLALGIALIVLGTAGLAFSVVLTIASVIAFGAMALFAGFLQLWHGLSTGATGWSGRGMHLLVGAAYVLFGGLLLWNPVSGSVGLTLMLAAFLLAIGVSRLFYAWRCRRQGWRWRFAGFAGFLDLLLAGMILYGWPATGLWVIGMFLAIEMIFTGSLLASVAWVARARSEDGLGDTEQLSQQAVFRERRV